MWTPSFTAYWTGEGWVTPATLRGGRRLRECSGGEAVLDPAGAACIVDDAELFEEPGELRKVVGDASEVVRIRTGDVAATLDAERLGHRVVDHQVGDEADGVRREVGSRGAHRR